MDVNTSKELTATPATSLNKSLSSGEIIYRNYDNLSSKQLSTASSDDTQITSNLSITNKYSEHHGENNLKSSQTPCLDPTRKSSISCSQQQNEKDEQPQGNHITNTKPSSTLAKDENTTRHTLSQRMKRKEKGTEPITSPLICPFCDVEFKHIPMNILKQFKRLDCLAYQKRLCEHSLRQHPGMPIPQCLLSIYITKDYVFDTYIHHLQTREVKKLLLKEESTQCNMILANDAKSSFTFVLLLIEQEKDEWFRIEPRTNPTVLNIKWNDMGKDDRFRIRDDLRKRADIF